MRRQLGAAFRMIVVMTALTGVVYPLAITGLAQAAFHKQANGSLVRFDGRIVGSSLIGQRFTGPRYFHPRPSAGDYDGLSSGASNSGPTNKAFLATVEARARAYRKENELRPGADVPVDAVTASASGLDPDISVANALLQARRVARARGLDVTTVRRLVADRTEDRVLGFVGEPRVNVLGLNMALDALR